MKIRRNQDEVDKSDEEEDDKKRVLLKVWSKHNTTNLLIVKPKINTYSKPKEQQSEGTKHANQY